MQAEEVLKLLYKKNWVRASVFQHTMYQSCNLIIISTQSPEHIIFYYFTNNQAVSFWTVWVLLNTVRMFHNELYDFLVSLSCKAVS